MPNSWTHFEPSPDSTCIAPPHPIEFGRWNIDEIIHASVLPFVFITIWRTFFCYVLSPYLGGYLARREFPNPHPKPSFLSTETTTLKLKRFNQLYRALQVQKSRVPRTKKRKNSQSDQKTQSDLHLTKNIKRRNESTTHRKRKPLILPPGLSPHQSADNLAFLASLDSDTTRAQIPHIMKEMECTLSQIREYYHYKKDYDAMRGLTRKMNEEAWKAVTMSFVTCYGIWVMAQEGFFSNPALLYQEWPQIESWRVFLYYQIATGYHAHRALWQFWEKQRTDAAAMFIHHWVTVCLIAGSWYWGIMNNGSVVMVVHDNADVFLPLAKIGRWLEWKALKNISFVMFVTCWVVSRIGLFTWFVIIPVFKYAPTAYSCHYHKVVLFLMLLLVLLALHLYWAHSILKVAAQWLCCAARIEDPRSDTEDDTEEVIIHPQEFSSEDDDTENGNGGMRSVHVNTFKSE